MAETLSPPPPFASRGLFRSGGLLAASHLAQFPAVCVKTNQPAEFRVRYHFAWPWEMVMWRVALGLALLCSAAGAVPAMIFAAFVGALLYGMKLILGHKLLVPLSAAIWRREQRRVLVFLCLDVFFCALLPLMRLSTFVLPLALLYYTVVVALSHFYLSPLKMDRADAHFVYLHGAHPDFLAALPEMPKTGPRKRGNQPNAGVWRLDDWLVVKAGMRLPERCLVTNEPATQHLSLRALWPNAVALALLFCSVICLNICGMILVMLVLLSAKRVHLKLPFNDAIFFRRRRAILVFMTALVCAWALVPIIARANMQLVVFYILVSSLCIAACWDAYVGLPVKIERAEGDFIFFSGVHKDYLAALPEY